MLVIHVTVSVKPEHARAFEEATAINAAASRQEPGVARFELIRRLDAPARFVIVEIYRDTDAPARHKETSHYKIWRDTVEPMMAEPRSSVKFENVTSLQ